MKVAAIIVTRGDVNLTAITHPLLETFPEVVVWDNSGPAVHVLTCDVDEWREYPVQDLSVYGRYAAIEYTDADLIYVQDDDCIVSDPMSLVGTWLDRAAHPRDDGESGPGIVVCNMPQEFRHDFYTDHALVGFGAVFHRDAPGRAFERFFEVTVDQEFFQRTCDIVFTALTPRVLVDVPKTNLWWAEDESRMYRQPQHVEERLRMLELVKQVRDAS